MSELLDFNSVVFIVSRKRCETNAVVVLSEQRLDRKRRNKILMFIVFIVR